MKPSERVKELCVEVCRLNGKPSPTVLEKMDALPVATMFYLDEEAERRAAFEAKVTKAIQQLEALAKPLRFVVAPPRDQLDSAKTAELVEQLKGAGAVLLPYGSSIPTEGPAPVGVYEGDGHPRARGYEPEVNEPEPESK